MATQINSGVINNLRRMKSRYEKAGDAESADKIQRRIDVWSGETLPKPKKPSSGIRLAAKLLLLLIVPPAFMIFLLAEYFDLMLALILILPGSIVLLGAALKNGANV